MTEELKGKTKFALIISPRFICENVTFYSRLREKKTFHRKKNLVKLSDFIFYSF